MHLMRYSNYYGAQWLKADGFSLFKKETALKGHRFSRANTWYNGADLACDARAIVDSTAGIGQGRYQAALLTGDTSRSHFGQGDMVRES